MTPLPLLVALAGDAEPVEHPFGERRTAHVTSLNPDAYGHEGDGAYGRFDGDLELGLGTGATLGFANGEMGVGVHGTARWYSTIGLYALYTETLSERPELERRLGFGLDVSPLFLLRWQRALESGPAVFDLALDSLTLSFGASAATPRGRGFGSHEAFEAALGFGVPLAARAPGPWLEFRANVTFPDAVRGEAQALLLLAWHFALVTPIVNGSERGER